MKKYKIALFLVYIFICSISTFEFAYSDSGSEPYTIADTAQTICTDGTSIICPNQSESYFGQDANYLGNAPNYQDNDDGTITDLNTGLMWQQDPGDKKTFTNAVAGAATFDLAGYSDWRLPTIKELYSLIQFNGTDISGLESLSGATYPFINTNFFTFEYGDESAGERLIDSQYWSSTEYVSTTFDGAETVFGVNFADGRIKGYPKLMGSTEKTEFVMYVRGNTQYGINDFIDNSDGTITDNATSLMWSKTDSGSGMNWADALQWVQDENTASYLGYNDWRLPNAKELQSIVDYTRAPATNGTPAIDPIFNTTAITAEGGGTDYPFFWTSTTHIAEGSDTQQHYDWAAYIAFGTGYGYMDGTLQDVHGAGCQRSDPKSGSASDYPSGHGPQGDVVRVTNFVRLVRGGAAETVITECPETVITESSLNVVLIVVIIGIAGSVVGVSIVFFKKRKLRSLGNE